MVYLTVNKLLEMVLSISYHTVCTIRRGKILLLVTWTVAILFFFTLTLLNVTYAASAGNLASVPTCGNGMTGRVSSTLKNHTVCSGNATSDAGKIPGNASVVEGKFPYNEVFTYFYTGLDFVFIVLVVSTHGYIFHKYCESKVDPALLRHASVHARRQESVWKVFRNSRFYVSCLLIFVFIFMVVLPKLLYFFYIEHVQHGVVQEIMGVVIGLLYYFSFIADVFIYVFLHPPLKRLLWRKVGKISCLSFLVPKTQREHEETLRMTFVENR